MKFFSLTIIFLISSSFLFAQAPPCMVQSDTSGIIKIAKKKHAYFTDNSVNKPFIQLNRETCEWTVISRKTGYTKKGNCKHTNGCTTVKTVTLVIDAQTKKVKRKDHKIVLYPNYE